jgi:hypothetical protein
MSTDVIRRALSARGLRLSAPVTCSGPYQGTHSTWTTSVTLVGYEGAATRTAGAAVAADGGAVAWSRRVAAAVVLMVSGCHAMKIYSLFSNNISS